MLARKKNPRSGNIEVSLSHLSHDVAHCQVIEKYKKYPLHYRESSEDSFGYFSIFLVRMFSIYLVLAF